MLKSPKWTMEKWREIVPEILSDLYGMTVELGGTISGEHGIGNKRKEYVPYALSEPAIEMHRAIKRALDPNLILNPGKIFEMDEE